MSAYEELLSAAEDVLGDYGLANIDAPCHRGITTMGNCARCKRALRLERIIAGITEYNKE